MLRYGNALLLAILTAAALFAAGARPAAVSHVAPPMPSGPTADRPSFDLGEKWVRTDGIFKESVIA